VLHLYQPSGASTQNSPCNCEGVISTNVLCAQMPDWKISMDLIAPYGLWGCNAPVWNFVQDSGVGRFSAFSASTFVYNTMGGIQQVQL